VAPVIATTILLRRGLAGVVWLVEVVFISESGSWRVTYGVWCNGSVAAVKEVG
jgi:hypothetical protein